MTFRFAITNVANEVKLSLTGMGDTMAHAATGAMRAAGLTLKTQGRANIGAAGFGGRWQNAWRVNVYPKTGDSLEPAAFGYHKIPYSAIFEEGGTIAGKKGMLWLPIGNNVPKAGRRKVATPRDLRAKGIKLFTMKGTHSGHPLLGTSIRDNGGKLTLAKLRKGTAGKRGTVHAIPLFFGVSSVTLRKRFNISGVAGQVSATLGEVYFAKLET